jgi:3-hydroxybutyryl-CoA dehydrogenase
VAPEAVLASNTSSIPVTSLAPSAPDPTRVVGMHFFNPAPVMALVEVISGMDSAPEALALARATGAAMGRRVIDAADGPGFVVNRCNRPFGLEGQKLVTDGVAGVEAIDRIVRRAGGFPMGPFELMDLVGIDTSLAVAESFHALSFGEPRWRPSPLSARMVAAGRLGRKAGRGWYAHPPGRPEDPPAPPRPAVPPAPGDVVVVAGAIPLADVLFEAAAEAGWDVRTPSDAEGDVPFLCVDCGADPDEPALQGGPQAVLVADGSLHQLDPGGASVGFHLLPPLGALVELTRGPGSSPAAIRRAETFFGSLGLAAEWVQDAPGLVLGRIVCQLVNEAAFALQERVASPGDIDAGMVLGLGHPRGPLAWGDEIGLLHVLSVLDALHAESGEERYRAAPLLRRLLSDEAELQPGA